MTLKEIKQIEFAQRINQEIISKHTSIKVRKIEGKKDFLEDNIIATLKPSKGIIINFRTN